MSNALLAWSTPMRFPLWLLIPFFLWLARAEAADSICIDPGLHHLRVDGQPEWEEFPDRAEAARYELKFEAKSNASEWTLQLRQQDVKQTWSVVLNEERLGDLVQDENDQVLYFAIPADRIADGENSLVVAQKTSRTSTPDDIRVGEVFLDHRSVSDLLQECTVEVAVIEQETREPLPARLTILNQHGALQTTGNSSNEHLAVRAGAIYTSTGKAQIRLPSGSYRIIAGRGFEYSIETADLSLIAGQVTRLQFAITRQVDTKGYVACDTHVHSRTHSGHGDATVRERMITLAGEGIELPIATDHNVLIDHDPYARDANVRGYFTPVIGNEVTTKVGHFNVFPVSARSQVPDHTLSNWDQILDAIFHTPGVKIAILNHARDIHSGVRPFGPKLFNDAVGEQLDNDAMRFNAMEILNSGAVQTDPLELMHDWMALLNRGHNVTPVGSSDSHDVARYIVGQGRTYIRCDDEDVSNIDVEQAVDNFLQGRVMVSYGLAADIRVNEIHGPETHGLGDLCPVSKDGIDVTVRVLGPDWVTASNVTLYANGKKIRDSEVVLDDTEKLPTGTLYRCHWKLPRPRHDVFLVAVATGPGIDGLHWKTAKPYQPTSPAWTSHVLGISGAVWLDVDGNNHKTSAREYADQQFRAANGDTRTLLRLLDGFDQSVACQAAHLYQRTGESLFSDELRAALRDASPETQAGFQLYTKAWRESELARASQ